MKVLTTEGLTKLIQLIKSSFISVNDTVTTNTVTLSTVATSGSYNDLSDKPSIPPAQVQSDWNQLDNTAVDYIKNKPIIPSSVTVDQTYNGLSTNAQSGVAIASAGFITGITSSDVTNVLGYTPCQADLSNCTKPYIVETYGHYNEHGFGTESWYRLWSDGFLEQGGKITPSADANAISITFLKTYDFLPTVVTTVHYNQGSYTANTSNCSNRNATLWACTIGNTSTSGFVVNRGGANWDINWRATGYVPIVA